MSNEHARAGHVVSLAVTIDLALDQDTALDVARRWAASNGMQPGMTSWDGERHALRVSAMTDPDNVPGLLYDATNVLFAILSNVGATITGWDAVEVLSADVVEQRLARRALPPTVTAVQFAELAGVTPSRIRQLAAQVAAGGRDDFPAPLLDGHWLRSEAQHWADNRRTRPGPAPKADRGGEASAAGA